MVSCAGAGAPGQNNAVFASVSDYDRGEFVANDIHTSAHPLDLGYCIGRARAIKRHGAPRLDATPREP